MPGILQMAAPVHDRQAHMLITNNTLLTEYSLPYQLQPLVTVQFVAQEESPDTWNL